MKPSSALYISLISVSLTGCGIADKTTSTSNIKSVVHESGAWDRIDPPVCIMNRKDVTKETFEALKNHAVAQYARAGVQLSGWNDCVPAQFDKNVIRISYAIPGEKEDKTIWGGGFVKYVGMTAKGIHRSKGIYSTLSNYTPFEDGSFDFSHATLVLYVRKDWPVEIKYQNVQLGTFLHELGHHLGLHHEHNHTNNTSSFPKDKQLGVFKDIGPYDPRSLMSYTRDRYLDINFTDGDIAGLKYLFRKFL